MVLETFFWGFCIDLASTSVVVSASPNPIVIGQSTTLTATISVLNPGSTTIASTSGTVTFSYGSQIGNPVQVSGGVASVTWTKVLSLSSKIKFDIIGMIGTRCCVLIKMKPNT